MKYAELRKRLRAAELHAADMKRQADTSNAVLLSLTREREGCGHHIIGREDWPCPHPGCSRCGGDVMWVESVKVPQMYEPGPLDPIMPERTRTLLRRERYRHPGGDIWAWRALP